MHLVNTETSKTIPFRPQHDLLLVKVLPVSQTEGGIYLPERMGETTMPTWTCEVIAVGPGSTSMMGKQEPINVPVGARIIVPKGQFPHLRIGGVEYMLVRYSNVLGILDD
jgi:chaperonin GroES